MKLILVLLAALSLGAPPALLCLDDESALNEARKALIAGRVDEALTAVNKVLDSDKDSEDAYLLRAQIHQQSRQFEKAEDDLTRALAIQSRAATLFERGVIRFYRANAEGSVKDFDRYLELVPSRTPHLWQRGLSHYYAGQFDAGRRQFESHREVNGNDVENSAWHFLCIARSAGLEEARRAFLSIDKTSAGRFPDSRRPMERVYELFAGTNGIDAVLKKAEEGELSDVRRREARLYAHLYAGLYEEVHDRPDKAREHIDQAVKQKLFGHYMWEVARVHQRLRAETKKSG